MKKLPVLLTLFVAASLILTACAGGNNNNGVGNNGTLTTPGVGDTFPTEDPNLVASPTAEIIDEVPPTEPVVEMTPTVDAGAGDVDLTATPEVGTGTELTGTPEAEVPVTGETMCSPNRLTNILDFDVVDQNNELIGEVDAVVFLRDAATAGAVVTDDDVVEDDAAGSDPAATVDPNAPADDAAGAQPVTPGSNVQPVIAYAVVDVEDMNEAYADLGDKDVLVPFSALTFVDPLVAADEAVQEAEEAADAQATPVMETPVDGEVVETPIPVENQNAANRPGIATCAFSTTIDPSVLAQAPAFDDDAWIDEFEAETFATYDEFWAGQGLTIPTTGENGAPLGSPVIFDEDFDDIDVENTNGDDLGEVEDFILDPQTGTVQYAVLATGGFLGLGERFIPVPMNQIQWGEMDDDAEDLGEMVINIPDDAWENAPAIESIDEIDNSVAGWDEEFQSFWNNLTAPVNE